MQHDLTLEGHGVRLVPLTREHAAALAAFVDERVWRGMTTPTPRGVDDLLGVVETALATPARYAFAVLVDGEVVGSTSFYDVDLRMGRLEVGHTFYDPRVWGTHVNPACKLLLMTHAFETWEVARCAYRVEARNARSIAAVTKLGARPEGRLRGHRVAADGTRQDSLYFSVLADEWPDVRARLVDRLAGHDVADGRTSVLLIGGRSGVGKSTAAAAVHDLLVARDVPHALVEGDALDLAHPAPWEHGVAAANLADVWRRYRALGHRRLVYTNTVSVLETETLAAAVGDRPHVTSVLLTSSDATARERLARREQGASYDAHVARSDAAAARLEQAAGPHVHRVPTDGRTPAEVAADLVALAGW
ncbi:GNAT family N-acetyltransferase [Cellulomonas iranensis]|uniref:RimJ/RimL family protein N-acetyltransferase n=1 Tax=Cellulomonas iranensis TaxID=76862 RepID=A0ABU0GLY5_9CELL|nr:GNAT family protein [Cellulomonas iranensis]MDQ0425949.1 RimJ/RimL family protein N-acetyltransferase [Cellulomonas iranensis]